MCTCKTGEKRKREIKHKSCMSEPHSPSSHQHPVSLLSPPSF